MLQRAQARSRATQQDMIRIFEQSRVNLDLVASSQGSEPQIKGRTFEVPACGGFLLDGRIDGIEEYFEVDREIVVYEDVDDMIDKARFYLEHDAARKAVAEAGYRRTHAEHTYRERFASIFRVMGLKPRTS